jgi:hypothetical protein
MLNAVIERHSNQVTPLAQSRQHRVIIEDDIPWMADLARRRYPGNYDVEAGEMWMRNIVLKQPMVFYPTRTARAFMVTLVSLLPWLPGEPEATVIMLCAEEGAIWDAVRLTKASYEWAIRRHCWRWGFNSDTDFDIGPLAHRLGLVTRCPRYVAYLNR